MLSPDNTKRGKLLSQYVCGRIIRMDDIDLGLFDYDRNNTLYYFILNADEQIYMRYGGRDSNSPDTYLNLDSIELAMEKGLELHKQYQGGELKKAERPKPMFAKDFPLLVERTFARNACVECHLIGDFQNQHRELDGTLDKLQHMYRSPNIKTIGIYLDVPKGLLVKETKDAVQAAGMKAGDVITAVNGTPVYTFGDFQYYYDKVSRKAEQVTFSVARESKTVDLPVKLPPRWWLTDLGYRQLTIEPRVYFDSRPLTAEEKKANGLDPDGFAGQVKYVGNFAELMKVHELKTGDIVYAVNGIQKDDLANTPELFIKLRTKAGEPCTVDYIRDGKRMKMEVRSQRMSFRK